jgi:hypothetical protein
LSTHLHRLVTEIEPIKIPSRERWEGLMVSASLKLPFDYSYFWALHFYRAPENFWRRVEEFNAAVESSGLIQLAHGKEPEFTLPAAIIKRGISDAKISTVFIESWFHLSMLYGRLCELRESNEEFASLLAAGAPQATIGQRVWFARWLIANSYSLERDRQDCPSSDDLRHITGLPKGGSGSSVIEIMRYAVDAASDGLRLSGA